MTYPVVVEQADHGYDAAVLGWPQVRATASTREAALAAVRAALRERLRQADVVMIDPDAEDPWQELAGKYAGDESLREICEEAYSARDREKVS